MADADKSIEILIKTKAELSGARAVLTSLQEQIGAARALGRETADLEAAEKRASATVAEYNEKLGSAIHETGRMAASHHALQQVMRLGGDEIAPEPGGALAGAREDPQGRVNAPTAAAARAHASDADQVKIETTADERAAGADIDGLRYRPATAETADRISAAETGGTNVTPASGNEVIGVNNAGKNRAGNAGASFSEDAAGGQAMPRDYRQLVDAQKATLKAFDELYDSERAHQAELFAFLTRWMQDYRDTRAQVADLERQLGYLAGRQRGNQNP